jgi:hypothetical protein
MPKLKPLEVRRSRPFNLTLAFFGLTLGVAAGGWALLEWTGLTVATGMATADEQASQGRLMWMALCASAMLYYAIRAVAHLRETAPQIVVDAQGIRLGFGRNVSIPWDSIRWMRVRGLRATLQLGIDPMLIGPMNLTLWNLDDNLCSVPGGGAAVGVRGQGLDHSMRDVAQVILAYRPQLPRMPN